VGNAREPFRIDERVTRSFVLTPAGKDVAEQLSRDGVAEEVSQLTPELLKEGAWRTKRFRKYTISLRAPRIAAGKRHPYREFLDLVKLKLVSMGFQEMRGTLVETEFWNMDALFMPQFHPARDIHDVYFVKNPTHARTIAEPYLTQVTQVHEKGTGAGSTGWGYAFDAERAKRLVLRSQGTAVSARTLAAGASVPGKYFSIARCFRYDQVDATHATDFFQVEGIVLGADINFPDPARIAESVRPGSGASQGSEISTGLFPVHRAVGRNACAPSEAGVDGIGRRRIIPARSDDPARCLCAGHCLGPWPRSYGDGGAGDSRHSRSCSRRTSNSFAPCGEVFRTTTRCPRFPFNETISKP
jgi:phenylalanyl-tRNA synthetase alpha subunit